MSNLISARDLQTILHQDNLVIIDTRFALSDPEQGRHDYEAGHIQGAVYFDLDKDLSSVPSTHGGRHPLPDWDEFAEKLGDAGIDNASHVVVYDDASGVFAGRLWWMLRYLGHNKVQVLDGGLSAWLESDYGVTPDTSKPTPKLFTPNIQTDMLVDMDYVKSNLENPEVVLVDARGEARYRGETEPLDPKAGHIPSAMNWSYDKNLNGKTYKATAELIEHVTQLGLDEAEEIIVYCGSGVSANHNLIALEEAGIKGAKLYVGSWSDWSSFDDNSVATGDEA